MNKYFLILGVLLSFLAQAQVTGPEQDCIDAIPISSAIVSQPNSYMGIGNIDDLNGSNSCLQNDETNSVWYIFQIYASGILEFDLIPNNSGPNGDDYDFAIFNLTGSSCSGISNGSAPEVRCNYAFSKGPTGLMMGFTQTSAGPGDSAFLAPLNVNVGEVYALLIDNFSSSGSGFVFDFSRSTAVIDTLPPCMMQPIALNPGWNLISSYIIPDSADMLNVIKDISQDVLLIKNGAGQTTIPALNINTIGNWNVSEGYKLKTSASDTLWIGCTQVDPAAVSISLSAGWNLISYLRDSPLDIATALSGISAQILIAKDGRGYSYIPLLGINSVGNMIPGSGYSLKMANPAMLTYPGN